MVVAVKEIQPRLVDLGASADLVANFEDLVRGRVVGRPLDQPVAVGISALGKVDPVCGDGFREFAVRILPGDKRPEKVAKNVRELAGMEGTQAGALRSRRPMAEVVLVDLMVPSRRSQPSPGA